mgnify:CR=1 FL=1
MKRYTVGIQEWEVYHFEVEAESPAEALRMARQNYDENGHAEWQFQAFDDDDCFIVDEQEVQA